MITLCNSNIINNVLKRLIICTRRFDYLNTRYTYVRRVFIRQNILLKRKIYNYRLAHVYSRRTAKD